MKPAPFEYRRVTNAEEAVAALAHGAGGAKLLAGGQSLVPMLNLRLAPVDLLVDISGAADLRRTTDTADGVVFGACVTHAEIEDGAAPDPRGDGGSHDGTSRQCSKPAACGSPTCRFCRACPSH